MEVLVKPLQWYVDNLAAGRPFSLARYGDGELLCMFGSDQIMNSNGCHYTDDLKRDLWSSMHHTEKNFLYGLQRVIPSDVERVQKTWPDIQWYDSEIFGDALVEGKLWPLIEQLRKMDIVVIGNNRLRTLYGEGILAPSRFVEVPPTDAHLLKVDVSGEILDHAYKNPDVQTVFLFSCGMAANVFVSQLFPILRNSFLLDVGHIWDPFVQAPITRCNTHGMTQEQIERNLRP